MPEQLLRGFQEFRSKVYGDNALMPRLVEEGQDPDYFMISCIDSRSNPGTIFNAAPGTFFAHKAMGAIVRPYKTGTALAAALQFAINHNNIKHLVILGHTGCGAIKALIDEIDDEEISSFIAVAKTGLAKAKEECSDCGKDLQKLAEEKILLQSTENLMTYPSVKQAVAEGRLEVLSWMFDMHEGAIYAHDADSDEFKKIS